MIESDFIRNANIRKTFQAVDSVRLPIELAQITILFDKSNSVLKDLDKDVHLRLMSDFIQLILDIFNMPENKTHLVGTSTEYRIDNSDGSPIILFRYFILSNNLDNNYRAIVKASKQLGVKFGGEVSTDYKNVKSKEGLFFELYPNTMLDDVVHKFYRGSKMKQMINDELVKILLEPVCFLPFIEFVDFQSA
jgi:hypothetical protein